MRTRRTAMIAALAILAALALVTTIRQPGGRAQGELHRVQLAGGDIVDGTFLTLDAGSYLLQTDSLTLIVRPQEVERIDGEPLPGTAIPAPDTPTFVHQTFEEILPSGDIEVRSVVLNRNTGSKPWHVLRWGLAPHELAYLDSYRMTDVFGHELPVHVVGERPGGGKWVEAQLVLPVFPGEQTPFTTTYREPAGTARQGEVWTYRHVGDYADQRLVTRSVLLPRGSDVLSVSPEPLHRLDMGGRQLIVWRRFFRRGERFPWEVRFTAPRPDDDSDR